MKRENEKVTSTAGLISTTTMENSPFLAVVENSSRKFAIKAALNGNIFMHCPVEMAEDFQVGFCFQYSFKNRLLVKLTRVGLIADWICDCLVFIICRFEPPWHEMIVVCCSKSFSKGAAYGCTLMSVVKRKRTDWSLGFLSM